MAGKRHIIGYAGVLSAALAVGFVPVTPRLDYYIYDLISRTDTYTAPPQSVVVAIDEETLQARGGTRNYRPILTEALQGLAQAQPAAIAIDMLLADRTEEQIDKPLEAAMLATPNLVLHSLLTSDGRWEDPLPLFKPLAKAVGHAHLELQRTDGISRSIALQVIADDDARYALALEAYKIARGAQIMESLEDLQIGDTAIDLPRDGARAMPIRFRAPGEIPTISVLQIPHNLEAIRGKVAFIGVTSLPAANDRLLNPAGVELPGVEIHAHAYETLARGDFLYPAGNTLVLAVCGMLVLAAGLAFWFLSGWRPYALGALLIVGAMASPIPFYAQGIVFPFFPPLATSWLGVAAAASYQHFVVRRQLRLAQSDKERYQQAIHWAAHEMRTPLTAIQGSSELMTRYNLPDAKRNQLSEMINSESKRLARIIQTFLDVERLAEGQVELKREPFTAADLVATCHQRVAPLAERKRISITLDTPIDGTLVGDRELMEFALYNLLTNAVKYSPADTQVRVRAALSAKELRLAVEDQGMGIDAKELKNIFNKFYRTKKAEASGEVGTGIGLSIVQQIVTSHGGRIDVTSTPGKGSCFTMILMARPVSQVASGAE